MKSYRFILLETHVKSRRTVPLTNVAMFTVDEGRAVATSLKTCAAKCSPQQGQCIAVPGGSHECVPLPFIQYHSCMEKCVPKDIETKVGACETTCKADKNLVACMEKCVPKDVEAKLEACGQQCRPKEPEKTKEEVQGIHAIQT
jgi:hypothetical protein